MTEIEYAIRVLVQDLKLELEDGSGFDDDDLASDLAILECVLGRICERLES